MADDLVLDAPVVDAAPVADATPVADPVADAPHPDGLTPPVDDSEAMWGDLKPEEPAPVDPNAAPVIPAEFTKALSISEYVKEAAHVEAAVQTASEVWDVVSGKKSASSLLEAMRSQNPTQYEKSMLEDIIPYIEKITGKKLGTSEAAPDPVAEMRAELERMKQQPLIERQEREKQELVNRAGQASDAKIAEFIKGGNGIFDGNHQGAIDAIAAQLPKLGITGDQLMQQVLAGNTANLERAYKAAEKAKTMEVKAYADAVKKRYQTLKGAVPASKGAGAAAVPGSDGHDMTTQAGRAKFMAAEFAAGR